jgi:5-methylcytosine-specific restriction endonuclease McrA
MYNIERKKSHANIDGFEIWNKGKKFPHKENCKCPICRQKRGEIKLTPWLGKHRSEETKNKIRKAQIGRKGELCNAWKGGLTEKNYLLRHILSNDLARWREKIYKRDKFTCQICGEVGGKLNAHHIKSFADIIKEYNIKTYNEGINCEKLWDINNGITLCVNCHKYRSSK